MPWCLVKEYGTYTYVHVIAVDLLGVRVYVRCRKSGGTVSPLTSHVRIARNWKVHLHARGGRGWSIANRGRTIGS